MIWGYGFNIVVICALVLRRAIPHEQDAHSFQGAFAFSL
jgi:hypothetical protein